ncbi:hypothetical protein ACIBO1_06995 [Micromonospora sp. NPDC049903]|uniref:hypothetical protein n=1 Tax=Micromonospora sp. NPDC049903 TaxID=3364276 RepID=UPI0037A07A37
MPAPLPVDARNKKMLKALFWGGVALAPVAALILLVADGNGPLRFAAVLAIMAVVLIGLSIALRTEGDGSARSEELRADLDELRRELRGEIVAAAQRGNQALDEAQRAQEALAGLRRRLEASAAQLAGTDEVPGPGRARVPAPAAEAPPRYAERPAGTYGAAQVAEPAAAGVYGAAATAEPDAAATGGYHDERPASRGGDERPSGYGAERPAGTAGVYGAANRQEAENRSGDHAHRPHGVVRHTETVHVTTRHTVVDGGVGESGGRYGGYGTSWPEERSRGGHAAERDERSWSDADERSHRGENRSWPPPPGREEERSWSGAGRADDRPRSGRAREDDASRAEPHQERSWAGSHDDRAGHRDDRAGHRDDRAGYRDEYAGYRDDRETGRDDRGWDGGAARWEAAPEAPAASRTARPDDTGEYWAQMRAGDRWAAVRDDDQGRELRVGERRAEVHADQSGTEYRMQDRWASVRQDEPRRGGAREEAWREGWGEPEGQPALPPGGVPVPQEWRPPRQRGQQPEPVRGRPEPEPYGRRHQAEEPGYDRQGYEPDRGRWR